MGRIRRGLVAVEPLAGERAMGSSDLFVAFVDARPETLLHLRGEGTVLAGRLGQRSPLGSPSGPVDLIGAQIGDLLAPDATALVMACATRVLETGETASCVWQAGAGPGGERSYWEARFTRCCDDEVLAVIDDATEDMCRREADRHVAELTGLMISAPRAGTENAVHDALRRTASFVGGRGALVLLPDDDGPQDFTIAHLWTPVAVPTNVPALAPGRHSWLADFLEDLAEPTILAVRDLPEEAELLRWITHRQDLAGVGLIPLVCAANRMGVIAVAFPTLPDRVSRLRFEALGALGPLLLSVRERQQRSTDEWLRHAEERFRSMLHRSPDLALGLDTEGRLSFVSPSVRDVLGYEESELLGGHVFDLVHPDDLAEALTRFQEFPRGGTRRSRVLRIRHHDGSWRSFECVLADLRDDPTMGGYLAVARDVTEQLESKDALQQSEDHIRALVQYSDDLFAVIDADGVLVHPTPNNALGHPKGSLVGQSTLNVVHPDDRDAALATLARAVEHPGRPIRVDLRAVHVDGSWRSFEVVMTNHLDDPAVGGIILNGHDVTERLEAERKRADSEAKFRFLAERATDMIYRYRLVPDAGFEYVSPAAEAMTGFVPEDFYANPGLMLQRMHPDDQQVAIQQMADPGPENILQRIRWRWLHKNGTWIWTEHRTAAILDDEGRMIAAEGIARDITEDVRAEQEIRERELISRSVLESIEGPAAVLDADGMVLRANEDWDTAMNSRDGYADPATGSRNYLALCDIEAAQGAPGAAQASAGVRAVLSGAQDSFSLDYPVSLPDGERWFVMRVSPLRTESSGAIVHHFDITDRKRYEQQLARQALHDPLTGLANRALLADRIEGALRRTRAGSAGVGILLLDLDRFSVVNDGLGYAAGDALLVAVSARLLALVRPGDTVARLAADEFVVLCEGLQGAQELGALAGRLVAAFADPLRAAADSEPITVTTSIGIALSERDASGDTMLRQADAAMHHAKDHGRSRFEFFDKRVHDRALTRLGLEAELRRAVDRGEFRVVYQPIVNLKSGDIDGVEALLRWEHPTRGLLLPEEFVAVAEDAGLLVPIGDWVLRQACRQTRRWQDSPFAIGNFRVCVNVAAQQMVSGFADHVAAVIREAGIDPRRLMLELTETALMDVQVARTASALHDVGVGFAIDDFGTGYSSMSYLKRFPVDVVKIDRSFIHGLGHDPDDTTIVGAIVNMTHTLGLVTVAEGIEENCQREALLSLGCDRGQGFLFGEAAEIESIDQLLAEASARTAGTVPARAPQPVG